jgi:hypothetical protein
LAEDEQTKLAEQIQRLILVQSFPPTDKVPGVFQRYLEMAQKHSAKE